MDGFRHGGILRSRRRSLVDLHAFEPRLALVDHFIWRFVPVHRDRRAALTDDLRRIGDAATVSVG
jgi:hypothetical protein